MSTPRDPRAFLYDMLDSAKYLRDVTKARSREDLDTDREFRGSVERELLIIGEAMYKPDDAAPALAAGVCERDKIIRFRHILVHGYFDVDLNVVWYVLRDKLSILIDDVERILRPIA